MVKGQLATANSPPGFENLTDQLRERALKLAYFSLSRRYSGEPETEKEDPKLGNLFVFHEKRLVKCLQETYVEEDDKGTQEILHELGKAGIILLDEVHSIPYYQFTSGSVHLEFAAHFVHSFYTAGGRTDPLVNVHLHIIDLDNEFLVSFLARWLPLFKLTVSNVSDEDERRGRNADLEAMLERLFLDPDRPERLLLGIDFLNLHGDLLENASKLRSEWRWMLLIRNGLEIVNRADRDRIEELLSSFSMWELNNLWDDVLPHRRHFKPEKNRDDNDTKGFYKPLLDWLKDLTAWESLLTRMYKRKSEIIKQDVSDSFHDLPTFMSDHDARTLQGILVTNRDLITQGDEWREFLAETQLGGCGLEDLVEAGATSPPSTAETQSLENIALEIVKATVTDFRIFPVEGTRGRTIMARLVLGLYEAPWVEDWDRTSLEKLCNKYGYFRDWTKSKY